MCGEVYGCAPPCDCDRLFGELYTECQALWSRDRDQRCPGHRDPSRLGLSPDDDPIDWCSDQGLTPTDPIGSRLRSDQVFVELFSPLELALCRLIPCFSLDQGCDRALEFGL